MNKRIVTLCLALVLILSLTACIRFEETVKINKNGTADVRMLMAASDALASMGDGDIIWIGHYIDHELVSNIEKDCKARIERAKGAGPVRFLFTIGGAGAQGEFFAQIIKIELP